MPRISGRSVDSTAQVLLRRTPRIRQMPGPRAPPPLVSLWLYTRSWATVLASSVPCRPGSGSSWCVCSPGNAPCACSCLAQRACIPYRPWACPASWACAPDPPGPHPSSVPLAGSWFLSNWDTDPDASQTLNLTRNYPVATFVDTAFLQ